MRIFRAIISGPPTAGMPACDGRTTGGVGDGNGEGEKEVGRTGGTEADGDGGVDCCTAFHRVDSRSNGFAAGMPGETGGAPRIDPDARSIAGIDGGVSCSRGSAGGPERAVAGGAA